VGARAVVWVVTAGVLGAQLAPWRMPAAGLTAAAVLLLGAARLARSRVLALTAAAVLAVAAGGARMRAVDSQVFPAGDVATLGLPCRTTIDGEVEDVRRTAERTIVLLRALAVDDGVVRGPVRGRVRLTARCALAKLRAGDAVRAATTLRAPRGFANPGSFDIVGHLARRGIRAIGSVWQCEDLERRPRPTRGIAVRLARWRERLARAIGRAVPPPRAAVLRALVLGDESGIDEAHRQAFTRAGVVHVLSVSGLHVGLVALATFALVRWLLARSERALLALDVRRIAAVASLGPVVLYGALAGFEVATLRSVIMAGLGVLAVLVRRRIEVLRMLALAAVAVALAQPGAPLEIGFQLSFVSVLALALGARRWAPGPATSWCKRLRATMVVTASAFAGTAPLTAMHFQQVSPMSLVANPLVVPLFGSLVVVLGLAGACVEPVSAPVATALFRLAGHALRPGIVLVEVLARPSWAALDVPAPSAIEVALLYALLAAAVVPGGSARRGLAAAAIIGLVVDAGCWVRERWAPGVLRVTFLDVGQGDAAVAELPDGRVLVVDAGGFAGSDFDTGAAIVAPYLATRKIRHVDAVVMTHAHPDHSGGVAFLLRRYRPREFWWSGWPGRGREWQRLVAAVADTGVPAAVRHRGDPLPAYAGTVSILHPPADWAVPALNETSLTMRLRYGRVGVLLTGDVEARAEASVLDDPNGLAAMVLKVPHHGSRTSSTADFVHAVGPRVAVISVGADNRYHLPSPEVEERYRAQGVCVLRTDRCGAVTIVTDGRRLQVTTARPGCTCPITTRDAG
jgi:competence protein ComEC